MSSTELLDGEVLCEELPDPVLDGVRLVNVQRPRTVFLLNDVIFEPRTGDVVIEGRPILESRPYSWNRVSGPLAPTSTESLLDRVYTGVRRTTYYHWLLEELPALLVAVAHRGKVPCLINGPAPPYALQSAKALGLELVEVSRPHSVDRFVLVDRCAEFDWPRTDSIGILRSAIHTTGVLDCEPTKKLFVSRNGSSRAGTRAADLEALARQHGFEVVRFHEMDWIDQLKAVASARIVVGQHGAGLANLIAASPSTAVHEVMSPSFSNPVYEVLSRRIHLTYARTLAEPDDVTAWASVFSSPI